MNDKNKQIELTEFEHASLLALVDEEILRALEGVEREKDKVLHLKDMREKFLDKNRV